MRLQPGQQLSQRMTEKEWSKERTLQNRTTSQGQYDKRWQDGFSEFLSSPDGVHPTQVLIYSDTPKERHDRWVELDDL